MILLLTKGLGNAKNAIRCMKHKVVKDLDSKVSTPVL